MRKPAKIGLGIFATLVGVIVIAGLASAGHKTPAAAPAAPTATAFPSATPAPAPLTSRASNGLRSQFAQDIAAADAAIDGCKPVDQRDDPGCANALTVMARVAYDIRSAAQRRPDSAAYADVIKAVDDMERTIEDFASHMCYLGYRASLTGGGSQRDQACSAYGFALSLNWLTIQMRVRTVEPG